MKSGLDIFQSGPTVQAFVSLRVLLDALRHDPLCTCVALVPLDRSAARARHVVALCVIVLVQVKLELFECGLAREVPVPLWVANDASGGAPEDTVVAIISCVCCLAREAEDGLFHHLGIARVGASLLGCFSVHVVLVVQEGLELIVAGVLGEPLIPLGVLEDELVLGEENVGVACLSRECRVAALELLRVRFLLLRNFAWLGADVLLMEVVLDFGETRLLAQTRVPLGVLGNLLLGVQDMRVALVASNGRVAVSTFLLSALACAVRGVTGLARLGATPLPTVQDLGVHEGLEVLQRRAVVEAKVPLWVHVPVPHGIDEVGMAALSRLCCVAVLEELFHCPSRETPKRRSLLAVPS
mmetsp:Transcript_87456/g.203453  ORF Transcript_87456/g.203453 Transcript_87456/m.203453 type:complete len:355 (+) Transcript_87456:174-1238(+)